MNDNREYPIGVKADPNLAVYYTTYEDTIFNLTDKLYKYGKAQLTRDANYSQANFGLMIEVFAATGRPYTYEVYPAFIEFRKKE